ncbi:MULTISPECIES: phage tail protein [Acinetobacter]|uniref:phage tail protein n=1 Tax=Acinetobacter TaxID=469 RepID=UPI0015B530F2|nr:MULTISPECIES: phage tail protein [Acinetobacter]MBT0886291.1 phage tail protein [Acinetobacter towneri]NWJ91698.1 phage tail protein [Acinetobacter sp. Swhac1]
MAEYYNVTTNLGDAEVANAIATNTKVDITHIAFGDGNGSVPTPSKSRTTLVREVHRQAVTKYERHPTNPNWIVIETIIPSDIGGFTIREMGIIGNGKLLSHGSHAPFEKVADPSGVSEYRLKFTQNITDGNVVSITLDDSLIFATQAWVEENFIKRSEIVDNLITADPNKPLSANAGKSLQDGKLGKNDNAVSATKLQTARTIGGVSFDGTSNINLPLLGYDQAWQNVKSSRNSGVVYTNTTGKPIQLFICANFDATGKIEIDGISLPIYDQEAYGFIFVVIPAGSTYKVTVVNTALLQTWAELR